MRVRQTEDGLHLTDSILWLDSQNVGELSFLSSAITIQQPKVPQVIATEETIKILEIFRKRPNALVCQYNRPFSIGRLKMELLPSGCVLGGASLYLETDKGRLLYAPQLQTHRIPTLRQMQLKKAHTLILGTPTPDPSVPLPNRRKEKDRLLETTLQHIASGQFPVILCEPISTAQELTKMFTDVAIPVATHDTIFKVNKVYESFGSKLGEYTRLWHRQIKQKVILLPLPGRRKLLNISGFGEAPVLSVQPSVEPFVHEGSAKVKGRFTISPYCDGPEIKEIVTIVAPKELYIFGPYAKRYVEGLQSSVPFIRPLFVNDQPTLF